MRCIASALRVMVAQIPWDKKLQEKFGIKATLRPGVIDGGLLLRQTYEALDHMPAELVRKCGIDEFIYRNDMGPNRTHYPNHGYFTPGTTNVTLNADIFYHPDLPDDFFDHRGYFISRPVQTIIHEMAHGYDEYNGLPSAKPDWLGISGWSETPKPGLKQIVIKEKGCPEHRGEWYYHPDSEFTRFYAKKNPWDDWADCFSFFVGNLRDAVPSKKRRYFDNLLDRYYS